jgi:hypothetical protein
MFEPTYLELEYSRRRFLAVSAAAGAAATLGPYLNAADALAKKGRKAAWPGEGQYLFAGGGMPDANYITGPTYLLNWGIKTVHKCDHRQLRAEAMAFTEMILRLGQTPRDQLRAYTL